MSGEEFLQKFGNIANSILSDNKDLVPNLVTTWFDDIDQMDNIIPMPRKDENVKFLSLLRLDDDAVSENFEAYARLCTSELSYCIHSTFSHSQSEPHYRIYVLSDRDMTPQEYPQVYQWFVDEFGFKMVDNCGKKLSQCMFYPCHKENQEPYGFIHIKDDVLNVDKILSQSPNIPLEGVTPQRKEKPSESPKIASNLVLKPKYEEFAKNCGWRVEKAFNEYFDCNPNFVDSYLSDFYTDRKTSANPDEICRWKALGAESTQGFILYKSGFYYSNHLSKDSIGGETHYAPFRLMLNKKFPFDNDKKEEYNKAYGKLMSFIENDSSMRDFRQSDLYKQARQEQIKENTMKIAQSVKDMNASANVTKKSDNDYISKETHSPQYQMAQWEDLSEIDPEDEALSEDEKLLKHERNLRYPSVSLKEFIDKPVKEKEWLLKDVIPTVGICGVAGEAGSGKSSFATDLALNIISGQKRYIGKDIKAQSKSVIYVTLEEMEEDVMQRLQEQSKKYNIKAENLNPFSLSIIFDSDNLAQRIEDYCKVSKPDLIIVEPLRKFTNDLNSATKIDEGLTPFFNIAQKYKTAFLFIHHKNKTRESFNGSQVIEDYLRVLFYFEAKDVYYKTIINKKNSFVKDKDQIYLYEDNHKNFTLQTQEGLVEEIFSKPKLNKDELDKELIQLYKKDGLRYKVIAEKMAEKYGIIMSENAVGKRINNLRKKVL